MVEEGVNVIQAAIERAEQMRQRQNVGAAAVVVRKAMDIAREALQALERDGAMTRQEDTALAVGYKQLERAFMSWANAYECRTADYAVRKGLDG